MKTRTSIRNEKGMATLETLPLLFVFIYMFSYMLGAFGIIHTGIKHSISARAYAFETFRNRTTLVYFRDIPTGDRRSYRAHGNRFHGILAESRDDADRTFRATERAIRMGIEITANPNQGDAATHNERIPASDDLVRGKRNQQVEVSPVWIMVQYGICLDTRCGNQ